MNAPDRRPREFRSWSGYDAESFETNDEERWREEQAYRRRANPTKTHPEDAWWFGIAALAACFAAVFASALFALGVL